MKTPPIDSILGSKEDSTSLPPSNFFKETYTDFDGSERPLTLRDYQMVAVEKLATHKRFLLGDDTGLGKCVAKGTWIGTEDGYIRIEDLVPDSLPSDQFGPPSRPFSVRMGRDSYPVKRCYNGGIKPSINIQTRLGFQITCTLVHPMKVRVQGSDIWRKARDIKIKDQLVLSPSISSSLPIPKGPVLPRNELERLRRQS